jgi:glycosidase
MPNVLDFPFARAMQDTAGGKNRLDELLDLFGKDPLYEGGEKTARSNPTFLGNHDMGRFAQFVRRNNPGAGAAEIQARVELGHAMLLTLRGVPTIYYGDEQGFISDGGDQEAREDMFGSKTAIYNDNVLLGTRATTATPRFDRAHPTYRLIGELARVRARTPALRRGAQVSRYAELDAPGLFAVSRFDPVTGKEVLLAFNTSDKPVSRNVAVEIRSSAFSALAGQCSPRAVAPGSVSVSLPPFGFAVCAAR